MNRAEVNDCTRALVALCVVPDPNERAIAIERMALADDHDPRTMVLAATFCMRALAASLASVTGGGALASDTDIDARLVWLLDAAAQS